MALTLTAMVPILCGVSMVITTNALNPHTVMCVKSRFQKVTGQYEFPVINNLISGKFIVQNAIKRLDMQLAIGLL